MQTNIRDFGERISFCRIPGKGKPWFLRDGVDVVIHAPSKWENMFLSNYWKKVGREGSTQFPLCIGKRQFREWKPVGGRACNW